jgi:hypothetical protein
MGRSGGSRAALLHGQMSAACVFAPTSQRQGARAFGLNRPPHSAQVAVRAAAPGCPAFFLGCRSGEAISGEAVSWCPAASSVAGAPRHQIGHFEIIGRNGVKADIDGPDDRKPSYSGRGRSLAGTAGYSQHRTFGSFVDSVGGYRPLRRHGPNRSDERPISAEDDLLCRSRPAAAGLHIPDRSETRAAVAKGL